MTTQTYIECAVAGVLGAAFHLFAIKVPAAQSRAKSANISITLGKIINTELTGIITNLLAIAILLLIAGEGLNFKPELQTWIVTIFAFCGFTGSTLLLALFGKINGQINKVVDIKTDMADNKITQAEGEQKLQDHPINK